MFFIIQINSTFATYDVGVISHCRKFKETINLINN